VSCRSCVAKSSPDYVSLVGVLIKCLYEMHGATIKIITGALQEDIRSHGNTGSFKKI
jgi:hypothetical protein